jgi:hypothetical protein
MNSSNVEGSTGFLAAFFSLAGFGSFSLPMAEYKERDRVLIAQYGTGRIQAKKSKGFECHSQSQTQLTMPTNPLHIKETLSKNQCTIRK